jgi:hypothetical protein
MIRIDRGQEPSALATARSTRLSAAVKTYNRHGAGSRELSDTLIGYNTQAIKDALYLAQAHATAGRSAEATARRQRLIADTLTASSPLAAATWCALEVWMPAARCTQLGLSTAARPTGV